MTPTAQLPSYLQQQPFVLSTTVMIVCDNHVVYEALNPTDGQVNEAIAIVREQNKRYFPTILNPELMQ